MPKTILVVDYDQASLAEIQSFLQGEDFELVTAQDGIQAQQLFEKKSPHLILTAALLPKLNGFELCKKISTGQLGEIRPVIIFSGIYKAEKYRKEAIIGCGAVDFLERPLAKWQLLKVIKKAFSEVPSGNTKPQAQLRSAVTTAGLNSQPNNITNSEPVLPPEDDLLEIDLNFERIMSGNTHNNPPTPKEQAVLEGIIHESDQSSALQAISPAEQLDDDVDAAVDAYRMDLDLEMRLRDQKIVGNIEEEIAKGRQNILELEAGVERKRAVLQQNPQTEVIELDSDTLPSPVETVPAQASGSHPGYTPDEPKRKTPEVPIPNFAIAKQAGNRLPLIAALLVVLLLVLLFWLRGL